MKKVTKKQAPEKKPAKKQVKDAKPNYQQTPSEKMDTVNYGLNPGQKPTMVKYSVSFEAVGEFFKSAKKKVSNFFKKLF
jgi:hypothetical protein